MRVLFVTPYYPPAHLGGIERAIMRLASALHTVAPETETSVITTSFAFPPRFLPGLPASSNEDGSAVYRLRAVPPASLPLFPYYSCPVTVFHPANVRSILSHTQPDIIHMVGDGWAAVHLLLLALRARHTAVVFTPSFHSMTRDRQWLRLPNRLICAAAERTTMLTRLEAAGVAAAYHVPPDRMRLAPWGMEVNTATSPAPGGTDGILRILCVGRVGAHKGQRWLVQTYAQAHRHFQRRTRLVLVGKDEGEAHQAVADAATLGVADDVELVGEVSDADLVQQYARASIFALFSHFEAFGLVYFEAMAHGVPVVTHRVGANAELLTRGAIVVAPFDREAATTALVRLVNDTDARHRLGQEARQLVQQQFTWERCALTFLQVYREATDERRRTTATGL